MKQLLLVFMMCCSLLASATSLKHVAVFGDSLSDNGNLYEYMKHLFPQDPPYYKGRFSNGLIWVELLTSYYYPNNVEDHLEDYAFGGAGVLEEDVPQDSNLFTLQKEVDSYLLAHNNKADDDCLYILWIGSNNYLALPEEAEHATATVLQGIKKEAQKLADKGAKNILLVSLPDLGKTPAAYDLGANDLLTYLSETHNQGLKQIINELKQTHQHVHWLHLEVEHIFHDALNNPEQYGFSPDKIKSTCYDADMAQLKHPSMLNISATIKPKQGVFSAFNPCEGYIFFDPVHPTYAAHKIMADMTQSLLSSEDIEFN